MWPFVICGARVLATDKDATESVAADLAAYAVNDAVVEVWLLRKIVDAIETVSAATIHRPPNCSPRTKTQPAAA
jgi:hypothetical protein